MESVSTCCFFYSAKQSSIGFNREASISIRTPQISVRFASSLSLSPPCCSFAHSTSTGLVRLEEGGHRTRRRTSGRPHSAPSVLVVAAEFEDERCFQLSCPTNKRTLLLPLPLIDCVQRESAGHSSLQRRGFFSWSGRAPVRSAEGRCWSCE